MGETVVKKEMIQVSDKDDCISRQAALKKLSVYIHVIDKTFGKGYLTDDDCMEAAKSVLGEDEIPAIQPEPKWIPCSERLPEEDGYYLVTASSAYGDITDIVLYLSDRWVKKASKIKAWKPLPEPYKGGDTE
jgi:hypothetical protein